MIRENDILAFSSCVHSVHGLLKGLLCFPGEKKCIGVPDANLPPFMNYEALIEFRAERDGLFVLLFTLTFEQTNAQIFPTSIETSHEYMHTLIR